jgi:hypothetical protein
MVKDLPAGPARVTAELRVVEVMESAVSLSPREIMSATRHSSIGSSNNDDRMWSLDISPAE